MSLKFFSEALLRSSRRNKVGHNLGPFSTSQKIVVSSGDDRAFLRICRL